MDNKLNIEVTHIYGPDDDVPGWSDKSNSDIKSKDNNYGSGKGTLTVNDLNEHSLGNSKKTQSNNNTNNGGGNDNNNQINSDSSNTDNSNGSDDSDNSDTEISDENNPLVPSDNDPGETNPYLDTMNKILDDAFQTLTPSTPNILLETAKGTLNIKTKTNPMKNPVEIATKVAAYFALTIVPKPKGVVGPVTSCSNNANSIVPKLTNDLIALSKSGKADNYESFVQTIYDNIANGAIVWNVVEMIPGSPPVYVPYTVTVT